MKKIFSIIASALLIASCGESLEDTYKDFSGDGEIRYVGKVRDLEVHPGWQRINIKWENGIDPIIDSIKVRWATDEFADSIYLPKGTTSYDIKNLTKGTNFEITVASVDKKKNASMPTTAYTRPYNEDHEAVQSFTRVVSRHFFLHNHLLMTFAGWDNQIDEAYIEYNKKSDGKVARFDLTKEVVGTLHVDVEDVDASKPVKLYRKGRMAGCDDEIVFSPYQLEDEIIFNTEFKNEMKRQFGYDEVIPESWSSSVTELDIDWDISDLVDLLYLPKLKTLNLGKNRFVHESMVDDAERSQSKIAEKEVTLWVLDRMNELNGLKVNRYDKHFSNLGEKSYISDKGHPVEPSYSLIDLKDASVSILPAEDEDLIWMGWSSHPEYLTDGNTATSWMPYQRNNVTTFTIDIDMKRAHKVHGLRLVQSYYDEANAAQRVLCPVAMKIMKSANGSFFPIATNLEETQLGCSTGEVNYIPFAEATDAQFIRIEVNTQMYFKAYQLSIAEIGLW